MAVESEIGHKIREARTGAGLTQEALARAVGLTVSSVRGWEYAGAHPRPATLRKIAEATGQTVAWFYEEREEAA